MKSGLYCLCRLYVSDYTLRYKGRTIQAICPKILTTYKKFEFQGKNK